MTPSTSSMTKKERHAGTRICVGCGVRVPSERRRLELCRLVLGPGDDAVPSVHADLGGSMAGRGAWVHTRRSCLEAAVKKGLGRAARGPVAVDLDRLCQEIAGQADRRVAGLLTAAWRAGRAALGTSALREAWREGRAELVIVAVDAAAAGDLGEVGAAFREGKALAWGDKVTLGALAGRGEIGVLGVLDEGIAAAVRHAAALGASLRSVRSAG
jgi:uncharacterized protein